MDWRYKALVQQVFSRLPGGEHLNYLGQKYITRNLPMSQDSFLRKVQSAKRNFEAYSKHSRYNSATGKVIFYEFGTGWDMIIPLSYYFLGIDSQILIDVQPHVRIELINDSLDKFRTCYQDLRTMFSTRLDGVINISQMNSMQQFGERFGISYRAPCDAKNTKIDSGSIDFISSSATLEHIPAHEILPIFEECHRILKSGGIMTCYIGYHDHYSCFDKSISAYNFYKYSSSVWRFFNSPLHYQNRLRHKDFVRIVNSTKFNIIEDIPYSPTAEDIRTLEVMRIHSSFKTGYQLNDLAIQDGFFVLKK